MEVDFLLIGQGLAGTILSYRLLEKGKKVLIIDLPNENKSSRVAAGLYNPITGKNMVKTWNADLLFPEIEPLFSELEKLLGIEILYQRPIYRPFSEIREQNEWMGKSGESGFEDYLIGVKTSSQYKEISDPFGGVFLKMTGFVDIAKLLDHYAHFLKKRKALLEEEFEEEKLKLETFGISYKNIKAKAVVYCNGLGSLKSKLFGKLPFAPVKGEILDIDQEFKPIEIINRGVFRITLPNGLIRVGSTYSWDDLSEMPTEEAKNELFEKLNKLVQTEEMKVIHHKIGIRPATRDRKPFLGKHPEYENVYIFNGFGAKGISLTPYYSKVMADFLICNNELDREVNISRFFNYI